MTDAAANCLSLPLGRLGVMLADCANFRALHVDMVDRAAALARIYEEGLPLPAADQYTIAEMTAYRPFAIIHHRGGQGFYSKRTGVSGSSFDWSDGGVMLIAIERTCANTSKNEPSSDAERQWRNAVGAILDDLKGLAGGEDYVAAERIEILAIGFGHPDDAVTEGVWQRVEIGVQWEGQG